MAPGDDLVKAANQALADPNVRAKVRQLHAEGAPLSKLIDEIGLNGKVPEPIRRILDSLPAPTLAGIRQATLQMLDSTTYEMPLACTASQEEIKSGSVSISVVLDQGRSVIQVK